MAIGLMVVGAVIVFGSFVFAVVNIGKQMKNIASGDIDKALSGFGEMLTRHLGAIIGMATGALALFLGLIIHLAQLSR